MIVIGDISIISLVRKSVFNESDIATSANDDRVRAVSADDVVATETCAAV